MYLCVCVFIDIPTVSESAACCLLCCADTPVVVLLVLLLAFCRGVVGAGTEGCSVVALGVLLGTAAGLCVVLGESGSGVVGAEPM